MINASKKWRCRTKGILSRILKWMEYQSSERINGARARERRIWEEKEERGREGGGDKGEGKDKKCSEEGKGNLIEWKKRSKEIKFAGNHCRQREIRGNDYVEKSRETKENKWIRKIIEKGRTKQKESFLLHWRVLVKRKRLRIKTFEPNIFHWVRAGFVISRIRPWISNERNAFK